MLLYGGYDYCDVANYAANTEGTGWVYVTDQWGWSPHPPFTVLDDLANGIANNC